MSWHIIAQIGQDDRFEPPLDDEAPRIHAVFERSDDRWYVRNNAIEKITETLGKALLPQSEDLLYLALAVYTADLRVPRYRAEDRWSRNFVLYLPVLEQELWEANREHAERTLGYLTGDTWELRFRLREEVESPIEEVEEVPTIEKVCLFSGGLDSGIGAIDLLNEGLQVGLVGHHGAGATNSFQVDVLAVVNRAYGEQLTEFMFHAQPPKHKIKEGEPSMRSRSFLFFAMGVAVASTVGPGTPLVVAENGFISLNVPLTPARSGSASTRTTHPHYVNLFRELLRRLSLDVPFNLPYRFSTKGEMLSACKNQQLLTDMTPLTMSCSHAEAGRFQGFSPGNHCGYCVPCIIRRAAITFAGTPDAAYNIDVRTAAPHHQTDGGRDLRAFQIAIARDENLSLDQAVFRILGQGPLPSADITDYAQMYLRGLSEVRSLLT